VQFNAPDAYKAPATLRFLQLGAKVRVTAAVDVSVAACESVKAVPEIAATVVLLGMPVPVTYIPGKIELFEFDNVTLVLPDIISPDGELDVVDPIAVKVSVMAAVDDVVAACESVRVVPEIAVTNVLLARSLPETPIPTKIAAFAADKVTVELDAVIPVAVVVCVVELTVAKESVTAAEDVAVAACESVRVVPEIAVTVVVPVVDIPVPVTIIPTPI
jgi:hypothetical protein